MTSAAALLQLAPPSLTSCQRSPVPPSPPPARLDKRMRKDQRGQQRAEKRMKGKGVKAAGGVKAGKAGKNRRR